MAANAQRRARLAQLERETEELRAQILELPAAAYERAVEQDPVEQDPVEQDAVEQDAARPARKPRAKPTAG